MTDRKAVIKNADMNEELQQEAVDCATAALEKFNVEKDIAAYIKKEFDKKFNPTWHCIVGRNFGSYVTHETRHFIYFYLATNFRQSIITSNISKRDLGQGTKEDVNKPIYDMTDPFKKEKSKCILCSLNIVPDYKNVKLLSQFQSSFTGRIYGKHITGLCTAKQKKVELEIQKAQSAGLMGYYNKDVSFMKDPKLFDPENPMRSHKY